MDTVKHKFSWLRLIAAIFVAFIASFVWYMILYQRYFGFVGAYWCNIFIGFFGVFVGGVCFKKHYRFLGSVILWAGGVALDGLFEDSDDKVYPLSVVWVAAGGLVAVAFYFWRQPPNHSPEPSAVDAGSSPAGSAPEVGRGSSHGLGSVYMQTKARKIVLMTVGVILLALGLGNTVPDLLRFFLSNSASQTLMINNVWVLAAVGGALLCAISLFTGKTKG